MSADNNEQSGRSVDGSVKVPRSDKEWKLIENLVYSAQKEQRAARRWRVFFRLVRLVVVLAVIGLFAGRGIEERGMVSMSESHTALIDIKGEITADGDASAERIIEAARDAFDNAHARGIVLRINSPGGSPVQAGIVYRELRRLREAQPEKKVYAVIEDVGASGAYYIAAGADEIYADQASIVGSIGVISEGFGFVDGMGKLGIERRVMTSGENKAFMDPFSPLDPRHKAYFTGLLKNVHEQFIAAVREGRGNRLKLVDGVFSGLVWSGQQALPIGLVDGLSDVDTVARDLVKAETVVNYTLQRSPFEQFAGKLGASFSHVFSSALLHEWVSLR